MLQPILASMVMLSLILPVISYHYFASLMKLIKVRRANVLFVGIIFIFIGYIFFLMPWMFIGEDVVEIKIFSYILILFGLSILLYGIVKIYLDWKEVIK